MPSSKKPAHVKDPLRALRGRVGAYSLHASHDSREITAPARKAFLAGFEDQVDPERTLPPGERARRADMARKAHFARLAYLSAKARRRRTSARQNGGGDDA